MINYSTSGYPGIEGTQIYKGVGNNNIAGAMSQITVEVPTSGIRYYFSCIPYAIINSLEMNGVISNSTATTVSVINKTFIASSSYTILSGYTKMDIFCVGAGGSGMYSLATSIAGGGGGGGYTKTVKGVTVSSGQIISCTVGAGEKRYPGGATLVSRSSTILCSADGGQAASNISPGHPASGEYGGNGGSGGGGGYHFEYKSPGNGGSNGEKGAGYIPGNGQGTTTRAWGDSSGTLYAGGGGGGGVGVYGIGGAGGGGNGGENSSNLVGNAGAANTGGGGGGCCRDITGPYYSAGGSGVVLIKIY